MEAPNLEFKKRAVSNRKQKVVGIQRWVWRGTGVQFQTPSGNLAARLGIRLKIWLAARPDKFMGLDQARFIPGDKFSSGARPNGGFACALAVRRGVRPEGE
jgi:hypothetical protein